MLNTFLTKVEEMLAGDGEEIKNSGAQTSQKFLSLLDRNWGNFSTSGCQLDDVAVYRHSLCVLREPGVGVHVWSLQGVQGVEHTISYSLSRVHFVSNLHFLHRWSSIPGSCSKRAESFRGIRDDFVKLGINVVPLLCESCPDYFLELISA